MNALRTLKRTVLKHKLEKKGFRRVNRYVMRYWEKQKKKVIGRYTSETSKRSTARKSHLLTSSRAAAPARTSAWRASGKG